MLDREEPEQRLLESVLPIRKRAGKLRDMDVLTGFSLAPPNEDECRLRLIEALSEKRRRYKRKLLKTAEANRKDACRPLKRYSTLIGTGMET